MPKTSDSKLTVKGIEIGIYSVDPNSEYISLTDIAKYRNSETFITICNWMRNRDTLEYLATWEMIHNQHFKPIEFDRFKNEAGRNSFVMSPEKWIKNTDAIGIVSRRGRYNSGTYAHVDIAMAFATWLSPEFQLYIMKDYRRLKTEESSKKKLAWDLRREISKLNYGIHTDAIKERLSPFKLRKDQLEQIYSDEADLLNVALFGMTAKEFHDKNPEKRGNLRDFATLEQLLVLSNLESYNSILIERGVTQSARLSELHDVACRQLQSLLNSTNLNNLL